MAQDLLSPSARPSQGPADLTGENLMGRAFLLDIDGTLLDIAPSPWDVVVSNGLRSSLHSLSQRTGGALALVSGRPADDIDRLFAPLRLPIIGGHGAELRRGADALLTREADELDLALRTRLKELGTLDP